LYQKQSNSAQKYKKTIKKQSKYNQNGHYNLDIYFEQLSWLRYTPKYQKSNKKSIKAQNRKL